MGLGLGSFFDAMTDVVLLQTVHKVLHREHIFLKLKSLVLVLLTAGACNRFPQCIVGQ